MKLTVFVLVAIALATINLNSAQAGIFRKHRNCCPSAPCTVPRPAGTVVEAVAALQGDVANLNGRVQQLEQIIAQQRLQLQQQAQPPR